MSVPLQSPISWSSLHTGTHPPETLFDAELRQDQYLYHMLQWPHAKEIFECGRFRLSRVDSWQDWYEKKWQTRIFGESGTSSVVQAYGLCWTTRRFDEPFWRLAGFRRNRPIVRIRCSVKDLLHTLGALNEDRVGEIFLGKVRYHRERDVKALASRTRTESCGDLQVAANLLLQKRRAFRFEREVRLLWLDRGIRRDCVSIPVSPGRVISQVMISPYADQTDAQRIKDCVKTWNICCKHSRVLKGA